MASDVAAAVTVESLQALLEEARDRSLRAQAELENFRKRTVRSLDEERRFAALPLVRDLLPVVDNLQRALAAAEQHDTGAGLLEGVQLVATQLAAILDRHHCALIPAEPGCAFDPHLHEAMAQLPATDCPPGHICHVLQPGYQLYDRVIRPAQVIVAALAPDAGSVSPEREATTDPASREAVPPDTDA
jgi:molecular chaperone GrpE